MRGGRPLGGWLLVFLVYLTVYSGFHLLTTFVRFLFDLTVYPALIAVIIGLFSLLPLVFVGLVVYGIVARKTWAVAFTELYLYFSIIIFVLGVFLVPESALIFGFFTLATVVWLEYFRLSERVEKTFSKSPQLEA